jgi:hypothetical protein
MKGSWRLLRFDVSCPELKSHGRLTSLIKWYSSGLLIQVYKEWSTRSRFSWRQVEYSFVHESHENTGTRYTERESSHIHKSVTTYTLRRETKTIIKSRS